MRNRTRQQGCVVSIPGCSGQRPQAIEPAGARPRLNGAIARHDCIKREMRLSALPPPTAPLFAAERSPLVRSPAGAPTELCAQRSLTAAVTAAAHWYDPRAAATYRKLLCARGVPMSQKQSGREGRRGPGGQGGQCGGKKAGGERAGETRGGEQARSKSVSMAARPTRPGQRRVQPGRRDGLASQRGNQLA